MYTFSSMLQEAVYSLDCKITANKQQLMFISKFHYSFFHSDRAIKEITTKLICFWSFPKCAFIFRSAEIQLLMGLKQG